MSLYPRRGPAWKRLTAEQQAAVAADAARIGIRGAAEKHNVSETAVRRACVLTATPPRDMRSKTDHATKVRRALALIKAMGLTPADLMGGADGQA